MENMQYAEELVREFLTFRGFTSTLRAFESELSTDIGRSFQVDKILELIFSQYIPKYQADKLISLLSFFKQCLFSSLDSVLISTLSKLELSILRFYIVHALNSGRKDKVVEFFGVNGNYLLQKREDWLPWFVIPYLKNPSLDPQFRVYFSKEWFDALFLSFRNFLKKITVKRLKNDIKQLNQKLSELQALLETREAEILRLSSTSSFTLATPIHQGESSTGDLSSEIASKDNTTDPRKRNLLESTIASSSHQGEEKLGANGESLGSNSESQWSSSLKSGPASSSMQRFGGDAEARNAYQISQSERKQDSLREDEFPEVKVDFQETFLGHTSPISRCRFSASGTNIASASVDGTVRIWTYDSSTPSSRNATIYCGAEIMSLDWECRSDRLLLIGTADGGIKAWNADAKRVVCDLSTTKEFPSVLDLKCSPVEPIFVSAAASRRHGSSKLEQVGFASLTVWNMKTWKAMTVLPLGEDPPAITSLSFNHNGKILAASATDGMIHMFDMSAGLQITGWPAHDSAIFEWSLHNQGQILWSRDCSRFCNPESLKKCWHEIALDSNGRRLLVTSGSVRSPIYQVQGHMNGLRTLPHSAGITSVDWHPTLPMFITGSADHSVRVTSIL
ncbi:WD repeat-containing protein 91 [Ananas comosus]|uniref:WD repeat-containing protein 91 n=1 Tax=Ananas comosus TaxID=4615 RepID=A0A199UQC0_ANACO|nr:WD repeat-containing protein 91 [Ananas comosus]